MPLIYLVLSSSQVSDAAEKIAGDNPLLWALVVGVSGLVVAIGVLWKAYREEANRNNDTGLLTQAIAAMSAMNSNMGEQQRQLDRIDQKLNRIETRTPPSR